MTFANPRRAIFVACTATALLLSAAPAALAQPGPNSGPVSWTAVRFAGPQGAREIRVTTEWAARTASGDRRARVALTEGGENPTREVQVYSGPAVRTDVAVADDAVLVGMVHPGLRPFVKLVVVPTNGRPRTINVPRSNDLSHQPDSITVCAEPEGFAILWQETSATSARGQARSFLARIDRAGNWRARPQSVAVPWALAAIAWNGNGYHLATYFSGSSPAQTRICGVTLSPEGRPEQHPWWATRQEMVGEVQLHRIGGRIMAVYRGGPAGTSLHSVDLTQPGRWGSEPSGTASLGSIDQAQEYGVRETAAGMDVQLR